MKRITRTGEVSLLPADNHRTSLGGLVASSSPSETIPDAYPFRLHTYVTPPDYEITLEQFEDWAWARLQVLQAVEEASLKYQREDELSKAVRIADEKWLPLHSNESSTAYPLAEERRKDHASHFILRLAFCNSADRIRWFVNQECCLFRIRFYNERAKERADFLKVCTTHLVLVPPNEKAQLLDLLKQGSPGKETDDFFKVPFELVPDLLSRRACLIRGGYAYVPRGDSFSVIMTRFRENLEFWMERTSRELATLRDDRLLPLLTLVTTSKVPGTPSNASQGFLEGKLTAADMETVPHTLSSLHHPCAQHDHHLRYNGRQQLGLFFKGIGLPLEAAIVVWQRLFVPKCGEDGFTKNYLYNIRHNYGQEGKRANYAPTGCSRIITGPSPGALETHGCPFRHSTPDALTAMLKSYSGPTGVTLDAGQVQEIAELSRGNHCQSACTRLFEHTRLQATGTIDVFSYPTRFFEASVRLVNKKLSQ